MSQVDEVALHSLLFECLSDSRARQPLIIDALSFTHSLFFVVYSFNSLMAFKGSNSGGNHEPNDYTS